MPRGIKYTDSQLIDLFKSVHGDTYDYSLVSYKNVNDKVDIICPHHGAFSQRVSSHLNGRGCAKCAIERNVEKKITKVGDLRVCKSCQKRLPFTSEYFVINNNCITGLRTVCKECVKENSKEWRAKFPDRAKKSQNKSYNKRRENGKRKADYHRRREEDVSFKIETALRRRIIHAIKGHSKAKRTMELIGCSIEYFKEHIESLFKEGMSWDNYGYYGWHIDHIIPCARFDLSISEEQLRCFHYTNLQPMWANENISKGCRI